MNGQQRFGGGGSHQRPGGPSDHSRGGTRPSDQETGWVREQAEKVRDMQTIRAETLVNVAEEAGKKLNEAGLKMNQIRRFLTEVREIEAQTKREGFQASHLDRVVLLRPKLAYAKGRESKVGPLLEILDPAIKSVRDGVGFKNLLRLVEGIVAYHRAAGGTN